MADAVESTGVHDVIEKHVQKLKRKRDSPGNLVDEALISRIHDLEKLSLDLPADVTKAANLSIKRHRFSESNGGLVLDIIDKRVRNYRKRFESICTLEEDLKHGGKIPNSDQCAKLSSKPLVDARKDELESLRPNLSDAVEAAVILAVAEAVTHSRNVDPVPVSFGSYVPTMSQVPPIHESKVTEGKGRDEEEEEFERIFPLHYQGEKKDSHCHQGVLRLSNDPEFDREVSVLKMDNCNKENLKIWDKIRHPNVAEMYALYFDSDSVQIVTERLTQSLRVFIEGKANEWRLSHDYVEDSSLSWWGFVKVDFKHIFRDIIMTTCDLRAKGVSIAWSMDDIMLGTDSKPRLLVASNERESGKFQWLRKVIHEFLSLPLNEFDYKCLPEELSRFLSLLDDDIKTSEQLQEGTVLHSCFRFKRRRKEGGDKGAEEGEEEGDGEEGVGVGEDHDEGLEDVGDGGVKGVEKPRNPKGLFHRFCRNVLHHYNNVAKRHKAATLEKDGILDELLYVWPNLVSILRDALIKTIEGETELHRKYLQDKLLIMTKDHQQRALDFATHWGLVSALSRDLRFSFW
ncbi:hypothetical protein RHGRI_018148 [Rhododendron griersonianum]|uniref:Uncharacterized protein n=1 Tax=Rhododendron griersonianum TaxID=479676 RepID=A0AAV6K0G6_9ERIC|nr:hypothetical protein RHGRI_018148 [Rhododendron griersonianum]